VEQRNGIISADTLLFLLLASVITLFIRVSNYTPLISPATLSMSLEGIFPTFFYQAKHESFYQDVDFMTGKYPYYDYSAQQFSRSSGKLPNVLVIISESHRADITPGFPGKTLKATMPALAALQSHPGAIAFDRAYSTTPHTAKALVSILCGIDPAPDVYAVEAYPKGMPVDCLPKLLTPFGYHSLFIQSVSENFESWRTMANTMGFDQAIAQEQLDPRWPKLGYLAMDDMAMLAPLEKWWTDQSSPRFATLLTSMTHFPYETLEQAQKRPPGFIKRDITQHHSLTGTFPLFSRVDEVLGKIIAFLKDRHELDNTLIVFTGDHGQAFGEHGLYMHNTILFEEGIKIPIVFFDGRSHEPARRDADMRSQIDIVPTILDRIGIHYAGNFPGKPLFAPGGHPILDILCFGNCAARIEGQMKWIYSPALESQNNNGLQAFSLNKDSDEQHDIAGAFPSERRQAILKAMQEAQDRRKVFYRFGPQPGLAAKSPE
jgi:phosphoglycerol transferase MdoB-like AlkP superfamily enzyme